MLADKLAEMQAVFDSKLQEALEKQAANDAAKHQQLATEAAKASFCKLLSCFSNKSTSVFAIRLCLCSQNDRSNVSETEH